MNIETKFQDPVKYCGLYKYEGCSHVDGFLCDFETCSMRLDYVKRYSTGEPPEKIFESLRTVPENKK